MLKVFTNGFMGNHLHTVKAFRDQVLHSMFDSFAYFLQKWTMNKLCNNNVNGELLVQRYVIWVMAFLDVR